jgi:hypothetical protein
MKNLITAAVIALGLASVPVLAQTTTPKAPATPQTSMDTTAEAKFKSADKDGNGMLSGAEATAYKSDMAKIDTNKDGNVSRDEFASAVKAGVIK